MIIEYTQPYWNDILEMKIRVSGGSGESITALNIVKEINSKVLELKIFPRRHKVWKNTDYRFFLVKGYLVFYRYNESAEKIIVERVIYSRRNIDSLI